MKKLFLQLGKFLALGLTLVASLGVFILLSRIDFGAYYKIGNYLFYEDYLRFKGVFSHLDLLLFLLLRVVLPLLGVALIVIQVKKWFQNSNQSFLKNGMVQIHRYFMKRDIYIRFSDVTIIALLLLFAEKALIKQGYTPGSYDKIFRLVDKVESYSFQYSDSTGVIRIDRASKHSPVAFGPVNHSGFRSRYEFDSASVAALRKSGKKLVMFIGDSYTEGFSAMPRDSCFVELVDKNPAYTALNFGMAGTDPVQYELVAREYIAAIKPDAVVVMNYYNDVMQYDRLPTPGIPQYYYNNSTPPGNLAAAQKPIEWGYKPNDVLKTEEESYQFYKSYCAVPQNTLLGKVCAKSTVTTLAFHTLAPRQKVIPPAERNCDLPYTYNHLKSIQQLCDKEQTRVLFCYIPHVTEISESAQQTKEKYASTFKDLPVHYINGLTMEDHVGVKGDTHLNNKGHVKYAAYVSGLLDSLFTAAK